MIQDITLDENLDLLIEDGDFVISDSIQQEILLLINTSVGSWKQSPLMGVGIQYYLRSAGQGQSLRRNINVNLEADGLISDEVIVNANDLSDITVVAHRNE